MTDNRNKKMGSTLVVFSVTISQDYFVTSLLSDIYIDDEKGAMKELEEICNGDNVDFYLLDDRRKVDAADYETLTEMISDVEYILNAGLDVRCCINLNTRYITPDGEDQEGKNDD